MVLIDAGMMGISLPDLYEMTEYEFNLYRQGYQKREIAFWERTRFEAWMIQATQTIKPLPIEKVLPLPTDKVEHEVDPKTLKTVKKVAQKKYDSFFQKLLE